MKRKRKLEQENRVRIVARVNPKFHEQVTRFARALKVSIQELCRSVTGVRDAGL